MNYKEKIELKREIMKDIYQCFSFDFFNGADTLSLNKVSKLIEKYDNELEGINKYEDSN